jgi:CheY-like chemotaxis protein
VWVGDSGLEALQWHAGEAGDLVLLDVMMSRMDGHEVCRRLTRSPDVHAGCLQSCGTDDLPPRLRSFG